MYLASIHRCSYPVCPDRWHCWGRAESDTAVAASHRVCLWRLCESSHSWSWDCKWSIKNVTISLRLHVKFELVSNSCFQIVQFLTLKPLEPGYLPIRSIHAQTPVLARLPLAVVSVVFTPVSLETGRAGASEAAGVAVASAAVETWLWLTLVNLDLTSGSCQHQKRQRCQRDGCGCHSDGGQRGNREKAFYWLWSWLHFNLPASHQQILCKNSLLYPAYLLYIWGSLRLMHQGEKCNWNLKSTTLFRLPAWQ